MSNSPADSHDVAVNLAHLGRTDEAYQWLDKALGQGKLEGLWFDLCWDHQDERFKRISKQVGLVP